MAPRFTARDDAAIEAAAAARTGVAWPETIELPDRGRISGRDAQKRFARAGARCKPELLKVDDVVKPSASPPPAKRTRRATPMQERAEAVGIIHLPTPPSQRAIVSDPSASAHAVAQARQAIHAHQKARSKKVARAEIRHSFHERQRLFQETLEREWETHCAIMHKAREEQHNEGVDNGTISADEPMGVWRPGAADLRNVEFDVINRVVTRLANEAAAAEDESIVNNFSIVKHITHLRWLSQRKYEWRNLREQRQVERWWLEIKQMHEAKRAVELEERRILASETLTGAEIIKIYKRHRAAGDCTCFACEVMNFASSVRCVARELEALSTDPSPPFWAAEDRRQTLAAAMRFPTWEAAAISRLRRLVGLRYDGLGGYGPRDGEDDDFHYCHYRFRRYYKHGADRLISFYDSVRHESR